MSSLAVGTPYSTLRAVALAHPCVRPWLHQETNAEISGFNDIPKVIRNRSPFHVLKTGCSDKCQLPSLLKYQSKTLDMILLVAIGVKKVSEVPAEKTTAASDALFTNYR
jgi:hypothetical protein